MQEVPKCGFDAVERVRMRKASGRAAPCGIDTVALRIGYPRVAYPRSSVVQMFIAGVVVVVVVVVRRCRVDL